MKNHTLEYGMAIGDYGVNVGSAETSLPVKIVTCGVKKWWKKRFFGVKIITLRWVMFQIVSKPYRFTILMQA